MPRDISRTDAAPAVRTYVRLCLNGLRYPLLPVAGALLLMGTLCAGCHNNKAFTTAYIESINAENRQLEDALYLREYEIQKLRKEQEKRTIPDPDERLPLEDSPPRKRLRSPSGLRTTPRRSEDVGPPKIEFDEAVPSIEGPITPKANSRPNLDPPEEPDPAPSLRPRSPDAELKPIEVPEVSKPPVLQREEDPAPPPPAPTSLPRKTLAPPAKRAPTPAAEELPTPKSAVKGVSYEAPVAKPSVEQVILNPTRTKALDLDARPGDDGLTLWIEPRDGDGKFLAEAGSVAVVALDPRQSGPVARLARWDLTAQQLSRRLMNVEGVRGYQLQLPWKEKTPEHSAVRVVIRYETADGRRLEASRDLEIELPPEPTQRWQPRSNSQRTSQQANRETPTVSLPTPAVRTASAEVPIPQPKTAWDEVTAPPAADDKTDDVPEPPKPAKRQDPPAAGSSGGKRAPPSSLSDDDVEPPRRPTWKASRETEDED